MHRARAFFYVAAGVFLLALSFHLGSRSASAQSGSLFRVLNSVNPLVIETGGQIYLLSETGWRPPSELPPVALGSILVGDSGTYLTVDGTAIRKNGYTGAWDSYPLPGSVIPTQQGTWGAVKARYR
jgi:hypothetical protein